MAIIPCPECGKRISNKADFCPSCGFKDIPREAAEDTQIAAAKETSQEGIKNTPIELPKQLSINITKCPKCEHEVSTRMEICPHCNSPLNKHLISCPNCHRDIVSTSETCGYCRFEINKPTVSLDEEIVKDENRAWIINTGVWIILIAVVGWAAIAVINHNKEKRVAINSPEVKSMTVNKPLTPTVSEKKYVTNTAPVNKNLQRYLSTEQAITNVDFSVAKGHDKIYLTFDFDNKIITLSNPAKGSKFTFKINGTYKEIGTMVGDTQNMLVYSPDAPAVKRFFFSTDINGFIFMENHDGKTTAFAGLTRL